MQQAIQEHLVIMDTKRRPIPESITLDKLGNSTLVHIRQSNRAKTDLYQNMSR
jgi:hypothetical protein